MTKKDYFEKYNGDYFRRFKDGEYTSLYYMGGIYFINICRNGHNIKRRVFGMDEFCWAWRIFQKYMKKARNAKSVADCWKDL